MSGRGTATNYTWTEEAYELDVTVRVPAATRAKDVLFRATSRSIDLRLQQPSSTTTTSSMVLLDKERPLRGRVNLDGTYWVISDPDHDKNKNDDDNNNYREVTVTIEKLIATPKDDFEVVDYDWKGLYADEWEGEVSERHYDEPEPLDVREYANSLGVDIDNIDMSKVDKTMFGNLNSLNMTQKTLDTLSEAGYLSSDEVTRQADGSEYTTDAEGNPVRVGDVASSSSPPASSSPAQQSARQPKQKSAGGAPAKPVPFLDTDSPWHKVNETVAQQTRNFTRAAFAKDSAKPADNSTSKNKNDNPFQKKAASSNGATDPIDMLTVKKLKEILKSQGLKVSGSKKELQDRLRSQVNALLQGKDVNTG